MLPTEYKNYDKFETKELKAEAVFDLFSGRNKKENESVNAWRFRCIDK